VKESNANPNGEAGAGFMGEKELSRESEKLGREKHAPLEYEKTGEKRGLAEKGRTSYRIWGGVKKRNWGGEEGSWGRPWTHQGRRMTTGHKT